MTDLQPVTRLYPLNPERKHPATVVLMEQVFGPGRLSAARLAMQCLIHAREMYISHGGALGDPDETRHRALMAAQQERAMYAEYGDSVLI